MKKLFLFASAAAFIATSCSDDLGFQDNSQPVAPAKGNTTLYASFQMNEGDIETRTTLGNNASKSYQWNTGDAVGIYGVNSSVVSMFSYIQGETGKPSVFNGDVDALYGDQFYGFYPYTQKPTIGTNEITMYINESQNYNHKLSALGEDYSLNPPTGSFANGEAPAVAIGTLKEGTETENELSMTFYPLATYLVFPVETYEQVNIQSLELTISDPKNPGNQQPLAGDIKVNLAGLLNNGKPVCEAPATGSAPKITLNCGGKGVTLEAGESTNFWFVIPSTTNLQGATINVDLFADNDTKPSYTITKTLGTNAPAQSGANTWYVVTPSKGEPWVYNPGNSYLISTPYQFLEYAYLVTNGVANSFDMYYALKNKNFSDLENMVTGVAGTNYTDAKVKNALILGELTFSVLDVKTWIGNAGTDAYKDDLAPYYQAVYGDYIDNEGYIPSIGGGEKVNPFTITGIKNAILNGLNIKGNGVFTSTSPRKDVNSLTLKNMTVDATGYSTPNFLGTPLNQNFSGVTVDETCDIMVDEGKTKVIFNEVLTQWIKDDTFVPYDVENNSTMKFANSLNDNSAYKYDFNVLPGIDQYYEIKVTKEDGAIFVIPDGNTDKDYTAAQNFIENVINVKDAAQGSVWGYSVIDSSTSYWTGTSYNGFNSKYPEVTAELFAYWAQAWGPASPKKLELNLNINLMNKHWWNNGGTNRQLEGNNFYIYNVYMDGYKDAEDKVAAPGNLTLLGNGSFVTGLNIYTMNIDNTKREWNTAIAAISSYPNTCAWDNELLNSVSVDNFHIKTNVALNDAVGGLYAYMNDWSWYEKLAPTVICNYGVVTDNDDIVSGPIAGVFNFDTDTEDVVSWTNVSTKYKNPFGKSVITITGAPESTTTFNLKGFNGAFIKDMGDNFVVGKGVALNYTVYVNDLTNYNYYYWMAKYNALRNLYFNYEGTRDPDGEINPASL